MTRRGEPRRVWTFVERIQDNENLALSWKSQHPYKTFLQSFVTWLSGAFFVRLVEAVEDITARAGAGGELI